ncbi:MAG TPA: tetratricopeptide repeat protein, partial [Polyangiaceae bacterium]|nr:tetratricopeptide repeat protein [Polyangiaceae bacterium]
MSPPDSGRVLSQEDFLFHLYRGSELLQDNRILEAKEELEQALTMQPLDAKGQDLLGAVYFRLGLYPRAIQIYEALEGQFPGDVSIKINLALCYLKTGQPEPARRVLRDVVQINPEHKRAWGYLGLALQKLGELEQAQIAFERGGRPSMARRVTEFRRSLYPPQEMPEREPRPSLVVEPPLSATSLENDRNVREMADAAFSELDAGDLRFALAEPADGPPGDAPWHTLELGELAPRRKSRSPPRSTFTKTLPPPWMGELDPERAPDADGASQPPPSIPISAPPPMRVPHIAEPLLVGALEVSEAPRRERIDGRRPGAPVPTLLAWETGASVEQHPSGAVLVRTGEAGGPFAGRLDALRVVAGSVTTHALHRRSRETETLEALGGSGAPLVRIAGEAQLVLGPRAGGRLALLAVENELAFVREDLLSGFELTLAYENGRVAFEPGTGEGVSVVQLRGRGSFVVDATGELRSLPSRPGQ